MGTLASGLIASAAAYLAAAGVATALLRRISHEHTTLASDFRLGLQQWPLLLAVGCVATLADRLGLDENL